MSGSTVSPASRITYAKFMAFVCLLCPLTNFKIGDIQPLEIFGASILLITFGLFVRNSGRYLETAENWAIAKLYFGFFLGVTIISLVDYRLQTFPPRDADILKTAPFTSIARLIQLLIELGLVLFVVRAITRWPALLHTLIQYYILAGVVCAVYALISWILILGGIDIGGAYIVDFPRARGTFVEGGPLGVYLVSVILILIVYRYELRSRSRAFWPIIMILLCAFALSASKAGVLLSLVLVGYFSVLKRKVRYIVLVLALLIPPLVAFDMVNGLQGYLVSYADYEQKLADDPDDVNLTTGRAVAIILVPLMTAAHPWTGVGFGNYSLQRNNPEFLEGLIPESKGWDLPGLGLVSYIAELGVPGFLLLCWVLWAPVRMLRKAHAAPIVCVLGSYQLFAHLFGVQLNFAYPWLVSAIGIGYGLVMQRSGSSLVSQDAQGNRPYTSNA